jgi:hypothetical protein
VSSWAPVTRSHAGPGNVPRCMLALDQSITKLDDSYTAATSMRFPVGAILAKKRIMRECVPLKTYSSTPVFDLTVRETRSLSESCGICGVNHSA